MTAVSQRQFRIILQEYDTSRSLLAKSELSRLFQVDDATTSSIVGAVPIVVFDELEPLEALEVRRRLEPLDKAGCRFIMTDNRSDEVPRINWPEMPEFARVDKADLAGAKTKTAEKDKGEKKAEAAKTKPKKAVESKSPETGEAVCSFACPSCGSPFSIYAGNGVAPAKGSAAKSVAPTIPVAKPLPAPITTQKSPKVSSFSFEDPLVKARQATREEIESGSHKIRGKKNIIEKDLGDPARSDPTQDFQRDGRVDESTKAPFQSSFPSSNTAIKPLPKKATDSEDLFSSRFEDEDDGFDGDFDKPEEDSSLGFDSDSDFDSDSGSDFDFDAGESDFDAGASDVIAESSFDELGDEPEPSLDDHRGDPLSESGEFEFSPHDSGSDMFGSDEFEAKASTAEEIFDSTASAGFDSEDSFDLFEDSGEIEPPPVAPMNTKPVELDPLEEQSFSEAELDALVAESREAPRVAKGEDGRRSDPFKKTRADEDPFDDEDSDPFADDDDSDIFGESPLEGAEASARLEEFRDEISNVLDPRESDSAFAVPASPTLDDLDALGLGQSGGERFLPDDDEDAFGFDDESSETNGNERRSLDSDEDFAFDVDEDEDDFSNFDSVTDFSSRSGEVQREKAVKGFRRGMSFDSALHLFDSGDLQPLDDGLGLVPEKASRDTESEIETRGELEKLEPMAASNLERNVRKSMDVPDPDEPRDSQSQSGDDWRKLEYSETYTMLGDEQKVRRQRRSGRLRRRGLVPLTASDEDFDLLAEKSPAREAKSGRMKRSDLDAKARAEPNKRSAKKKVDPFARARSGRTRRAKNDPFDSEESFESEVAPEPNLEDSASPIPAARSKSARRSRPDLDEGEYGLVLSRINNDNKRSEAARLISEIQGSKMDDAMRLTERTIIPVLKGVSKETAELHLERFRRKQISGRVTKRRSNTGASRSR